MSPVNRSDKEPAYLLHRIPFSESSLIGYFFTREHGVMHLMMKGARKNKQLTGIIQPAQELFIAWSGRTELKTLCDIHIRKGHAAYAGKFLIVLMYLNELLYKLLKPFDAHAKLYDAYQDLLRDAENTPLSEKALRSFEYTLFAELGYGLSFAHDHGSKQPIKADLFYIYDPSGGFRQSREAGAENVYPGRILIAIGRRELDDPRVLRAAKLLNRAVLHHLLEGRPLVSRSLLVRPPFSQEDRQ